MRVWSEMFPNQGSYEMSSSTVLTFLNDANAKMDT